MLTAALCTDWGEATSESTWLETMEKTNSAGEMGHIKDAANVTVARITCKTSEEVIPFYAA